MPKGEGTAPVSAEADDVAIECLTFADEAIRVFKALADRTRYEVVRTLVASDEVCCAQFVETFDLSAPALSHHLRVLESCGLIQGRKQGLHMFYRLNREQLRQYVPEFERVHVQRPPDALAASA